MNIQTFRMDEEGSPILIHGYEKPTSAIRHVLNAFFTPEILVSPKKTMFSVPLAYPISDVRRIIFQDRGSGFVPLFALVDTRKYLKEVVNDPEDLVLLMGGLQRARRNISIDSGFQSELAYHYMGFLLSLSQFDYKSFNLEEKLLNIRKQLLSERQ